jgi:hypothetical protein
LKIPGSEHIQTKELVEAQKEKQQLMDQVSKLQQKNDRLGYIIDKVKEENEATTPCKLKNVEIMELKSQLEEINIIINHCHKQFIERETL